MNNTHLNNQQYTAERKFIDIQAANEWEVEGENGWQDISSINKTIPYKVFRLIFENGKKLKCADTHILIDEKDNEVFAINSLNTYIKTKYGKSKVISIEETCETDEMFDLSLSGAEHTFYTNSILSHNSTVTAACVLWYLIFEQYKNVAILANKGATAREILSRIQGMYENLPKWLQVGVTEWNKGSFTLGNNNTCVAAATSSSAIRGRSVNFLLLDEYGFVPNNQAKEFFESVYPTISSGKESKITMISTPNGLNHFHKFWDDAQKGRNAFKPFSIKWNDVPGRDEKWKEEQIGILGMDGWLQEMEASFLSTAGTLISSSKLNTLTHKEPIKTLENLKIYEEPQPNRSYFAAVDVARGGGGDYSIIQVLDITEKPYKQVAVYRCNTIDYVKFEDVIYNVCRKYNAKVLIEENDLGESVARDLWENLELDDLLTCDGKDLNIISAHKKQFGIKTTSKTKRIGCNNLKVLIENDILLINDLDTIKELSLFTKHGESYKAEEGFNDDLVMGLVLFACAAQCQNFNDFTDTKYEWKKELHLSQEEMPFGFYDDGIETITW